MWLHLLVYAPPRCATLKCATSVRRYTHSSTVALAMKLFMILVPLLLEATVAFPCGWAGAGVTPEWQFTTTGGADDHQWSDSSSMIRFDFDDDLICARENGNPNGNGAVQGGRATWTMNLPHAATVTLSMNGRAEAHYETMTLTSDGNLITTVTASNQPDPSLPGYCLVHTCHMCEVSMPPTTLHLAAGSHTLVVEVTSDDHQYHEGAFFEIDFTVEGVPDCHPPPPHPPPPPSPPPPSPPSPPPPSPPSPPPAPPKSCYCYGDPHCRPFPTSLHPGGERYDFMASKGVYEVARFCTPAPPPCGRCEVDVQAFMGRRLNGFQPSTHNPHSYMVAVAVRICQWTFEFAPRRPGATWSWTDSYVDTVTIRDATGAQQGSFGMTSHSSSPAWSNGLVWGPASTGPCGVSLERDSRYGWRLHLPAGAGSVVVKATKYTPRLPFKYETLFTVAPSVIDQPPADCPRANSGLCFEPCPAVPLTPPPTECTHSPCHPVLTTEAAFAASTLSELEAGWWYEGSWYNNGGNPSTRSCRRRLQVETIEPPPLVASNFSYIDMCAGAGIDPKAALASCNTGCDTKMDEDCAYDLCSSGAASVPDEYREITCALDKWARNGTLLPAPPPPALPPLPAPPPPAPPPSPLSPCEKLHACKDECASDHVVCKSGCADKKKCKKYCKKDKKTCKNSCESKFKCPNPPSPPPSCEDNTIPGFGSWWCEMSAPDPSFCSNEAQMNKCKKTCGLCG